MFYIILAKPIQLHNCKLTQRMDSPLHANIRELSLTCGARVHVCLQHLFPQITPLANVLVIDTRHIWYKPNIFSQLAPKVNIC